MAVSAETSGKPNWVFVPHIKALFLNLLGENMRSTQAIVDNSMKCEVITAMNFMITVCWNVTPCSLVDTCISVIRSAKISSSTLIRI
jgi:hypothetical protein